MTCTSPRLRQTSFVCTCCSGATISPLVAPTTTLATSGADGGYSVASVCDSVEYVIAAADFVSSTVSGSDLSGGTVTLRRIGEFWCLVDTMIL